jgi:hypothetical protein
MTARTYQETADAPGRISDMAAYYFRVILAVAGFRLILQR